MNHPLISVEDFSFSYNSGSVSQRKKALCSVNLEICSGEKVIIAGSSGSGKSTLIQALTGIIPWSVKGLIRGSVHVRGMDTKDYSISDISSVVGYVFQNPDHQIITNDVDSEIAFGPEQKGMDTADIESEIDLVTEALGISNLRGREIPELSWGEKQKVAIASVLALKPDLLLLDEPLSGLDSNSAVRLLKYLSMVNEKYGTAIVVVEHRIDHLDSFADRAVLLEDGKIVSDISAGEYFSAEYSDKYRPSRKSASEEIICHTDIPDNLFYPELLGGKNNPGLNIRNINRPIPSLKVRNLFYAYPGQIKYVLKGLNADFFPGEATVIFGSNGSGKSTFGRHLNGLLRPVSGSVILNGEDLSGYTVAEASRQVSLLSQHADYQLFGETICEEVTFGPRNIYPDYACIDRNTEDVMEMLDILRLGMDARPLKLSVGEKQRVAITGCLATDTPVVVMDEPTLGLDFSLKERLGLLIMSLKRRGKTVIVFTHDREFGYSFADKVCIFRDGVLHNVTGNTDNSPYGAGYKDMGDFQ
ncbi:ABC transporter ATP-binding protein [Methanoplanus endosymbiosus]|uniref:Energy-coupling factor ABC transporter ATP-binding protein n=1 Tax=Methanoplanus endosymbiosus TaxID=33865 RepID=A0A9E7PK80_9EURY|nr:ABC transporter ATP-binding protein [Methanoplanus endosymbiosus]UUX91583.1 energy-coupling factor ABC transporter ATP-binding protein [Methanoplanus endosymbiosus]